MPDFGPDSRSGRAEDEVQSLIEWYLGIEAKEVSDSMRQLQNTLGWAFEAATRPVDAPLVCAIPLSLVEDLKNNIEQGAVQNRGKHASSMLLLKRLIKEGAPIHGVGIQGHWSLNTRIPDVEKAIENYASLGLKVCISELDVTATGSNTGAFGNQGGGAVTAEALQQQAQVYAKLFDIFDRHSKSISRVTFWGISDRRSWRGRQRPLLFDAQLQPKPALQAILNVSEAK